jgi:ABC-type phosphate transport system substrate-binding protein
MRSVSLTRRALVAASALVVVATGWVALGSGIPAGASTAGTLGGEGGDAIGPVILKLMKDDTAGLAPDSGSYTNVDLDQGIADFVGSAPNTFNADFAVTERPLTSAEAATAKTNGRSFAYVPIAAVPVALMTVVPNGSSSISTTISPGQYCQHIPLSLTQLDGIFGSPPYAGWGDSNLSCTAPPNTPADAVHFAPWANADPTMENEALMSLLDSTAASKQSFTAGLTAAQTAGQATTADPTATEHWPFSGTTITGGDEATLETVVGLDSRTGAPSTLVARLKLGAIMPIANDWTGDPLGVEWNLPTAAVQNTPTPTSAPFVIPSAASALAAEKQATLASTADPTTNNLVQFDTTDTPDPTAYNPNLMLESYLVVPLNGLPGDKALALAQFIRFAVGGTGQSDITNLGVAPATTAMVKADLVVAQQLDAEAAADPTSSSSTTTSTTAASSTSTTAAAAGTSGTSTAGNTGAGVSTGASSTGGGGLAVTGSDVIPLVAVGLAFVVCGEVARQLLRRRRARS